MTLDKFILTPEVYPEFKDKIDNEYIAFAYAQGKWIGNKRIAKFYVFWDKNQIISTYEIPEIKIKKEIIQLAPIKKVYETAQEKREFSRHAAEFGIRFCKPYSLYELNLNFTEHKLDLLGQNPKMDIFCSSKKKTN